MSKLGSINKTSPNIIRRLPMAHEKGLAQHYAGKLGTFREFQSLDREKTSKMSQNSPDPHTL